MNGCGESTEMCIENTERFDFIIYWGYETCNAKDREEVVGDCNRG